MAEYLILIYEDESAYATATPEVLQQVMDAHNRFAEQVGELGGKIVGGNALQPTSTATTIRDDVVTDGPFAETKEALGGYYLIEAARPGPRAGDRQALPGAVRRRRGPADHGVRREPSTRWPPTDAEVAPRRAWPTRTVASGPTCSPRRRASPATSTWPRSACRTPTSSRPGRLGARGRPAQSRAPG